jgi:hypothetical protein
MSGEVLIWDCHLPHNIMNHTQERFANNARPITKFCSLAISRSPDKLAANLETYQFPLDVRTKISGFTMLKLHSRRAAIHLIVIMGDRCSRKKKISFGCDVTVPGYDTAPYNRARRGILLLH